MVVEGTLVCLVQMVAPAITLNPFLETRKTIECVNIGRKRSEERARDSLGMSAEKI